METAEKPDGSSFFSTELYAFLRSPFRDLSVYDTVVQVNYHLMENARVNV